jgi:hypothetical protein
MDILVGIKDVVIALVYSLPEGLTCFILRIGILLVLATAFLMLAWFYLPWRFVFSQTCIAFITFIISLYIPVEEFREAGEGFLAFMVSFAFLCMIFLPNWLPFWLTPRLGNQLILKKIFRCVIWGLFLLQIIMG